MNTETIVLGGGCFWCLEAVFKRLRGVEEVVSGYAGGSTENPTYDQVCSGRTGHAEVMRVTFDSSVISLQDLLHVFFTMHDPTTPNQQGADIGTQYRSIVLYADNAQREVVQKVLEEMVAQDLWEDPVVTEVVPLEDFYPAEDYHQEYFERNQNQGYCRLVIAPKIAKLRKEFQDRLVDQA